MSRKISVGAAITLMIIVAAVTVSITQIWSQASFNNKMADINKRTTVYNKVAEIDRVVRQNYIGNIDEEKLLHSIGNGYISGLGDKYSAYLDPKQYNKQLQGYAGKLVGVGIAVMPDPSNYFVVNEVYKDTPADVAGIKKGDIIVKIDNQDIAVLGYEKAREMFYGEVGTKVNITYRREGKDTSIDIIRRQFEVPSVSFRVIDQVAYIKITEFNDNTDSQFLKAINQAIDLKVKGYIFDVRNNTGGKVKSVAAILDRLVPEGIIVTAKDKKGNNIKDMEFRSDARELIAPMTVLVNERTASAAELFSATLRDYDKALLVGNKTYGKGTVLDYYRLNDGSAIVLSMGLFYTKSGVNLEGEGLKPDYEVKLTDEEKASLAQIDIVEDPQFQKALQVVLAVEK